MTIAEELLLTKQLLLLCYDKIEERGGEVPEVLSLANLPAAIESITGGATVLKGEGAPPESLGQPGDLYFQTDAY